MRHTAFKVIGSDAAVLMDSLEFIDLASNGFVTLLSNTATLFYQLFPDFQGKEDPGPLITIGIPLKHRQSRFLKFCMYAYFLYLSLETVRIT